MTNLTGELAAIDFINSDSAMSGVTKLLPLITGGALAVGVLVKSFTKIHQGERGIRTHGGNPYDKDGNVIEILGPKIHFAFPFTNTIEVISVRDRSVDLDVIRARMDNNGPQREYESSIIWTVKDDEASIIKAKYGTDDEKQLASAVVNICSAGLNRVVSDWRSIEAVDIDEVAAGVIEVTSEPLDAYGVMLRAFQLKCHDLSFGEMVRQSGQSAAITSAVTAHEAN